jgi:erythrin-vacuolar iron transport family protein
MPQPIDFATLSLKDALDLAILIEDEARERYEEFVDQLELHHTMEAAQFFRHMAVNETKHGDELSARRKELFGDAPRTVTGACCGTSRRRSTTRRACSCRRATPWKSRSTPRRRPTISSPAALQHVTDPEVKALFEELRDEEIEHQHLVNQHLAKLPPDSDVDPDDYADEPVSH